MFIIEKFNLNLEAAIEGAKISLHGSNLTLNINLWTHANFVGHLRFFLRKVNAIVKSLKAVYLEDATD